MLDCWNSDQSHTSDHETNQANCTEWTIQAFFKFSICSEEHPNIEEPSHNGEHHGDDLGNHGSPILDGEELAAILTVCADHVKISRTQATRSAIATPAPQAALIAE